MRQPLVIIGDLQIYFADNPTKTIIDSHYRCAHTIKKPHRSGVWILLNKFA